LELIEKLVVEAEDDGFAVAPLTERDMTGLSVAVFDPPHLKASASGVAAMRGEAGTSETNPLDQTWDRDDLKAVADRMRGLREKLQRRQEE